MTHRSVLLILAITIAPAISAPRATGASQAVERRLYVSVVDENGSVVNGLSAHDFIVREDGVRREVLRVAPATEPMQIAVLVDNSQAATDAIANVRRALAAFIEKLHGAHELSLVSLGDRPTIVVDTTRDLEPLKRGVARLFAQPGSGAYLLEAIVETLRGFRKREASRPVIVAIITEGPEFSNEHYEDVLKPLVDSGAAFHALVLTDTDRDVLSDAVRNRNLVLDLGTRRTGGRRDSLLSSMALDDGLAKLADELSHQYVVVYARPQSLIPPERIEVAAARRGLSARGTPVRERAKG